MNHWWNINEIISKSSPIDNSLKNQWFINVHWWFINDSLKTVWLGYTFNLNYDFYLEQA